MHHLNGYINGHLESRKSDSFWTEWVPNTFPFYNLAPESRFWFIDSALSFLYFQIVIQEMKPYNFPLLNCNLGNKALILNLRISICHSNVMHHLNGYINCHLESRRSDSIWIKSVPNTFPFYNLALESRFWFINSVLSFLCFQIVIQEMKPCNFPLLNYNIGNKAL